MQKIIFIHILCFIGEQKKTNSSSSIDRSQLTNVQQQLNGIAKQLLKQYICSQGYNLSQMLRKSIETRDWINTIEPRHVRSVMKRIIEDLTQIDKQVPQGQWNVFCSKFQVLCHGMSQNHAILCHGMCFVSQVSTVLCQVSFSKANASVHLSTTK